MPSKARPNKARQAPRKRAQRRNGSSHLLQTQSVMALGYNVNSVPLFPVSVRQPRMLYYDWSQTISPSAGTALGRYFSANGAFDPDISGTGHQPMGFDQMMLLYNQYTVYGCTITITITSESAPARVGIKLLPDTTALSDPIKLVENGLISTILLDGDSGGSGTGQRQGRLTATTRVAKYFGRPDDRTLLNDVDLQGTAAANPTEQLYWGVFAWQGANAADTAVIYYDVLLEYDIVFFEPRMLNQS